jgi:hypothetical protein
MAHDGEVEYVDQITQMRRAAKESEKDRDEWKANYDALFESQIRLRVESEQEIAKLKARIVELEKPERANGSAEQ